MSGYFSRGITSDPDVGTQRSGWIRIVAKFNGICVACGQPTIAGKLIRYNPGRGTGRQVAHDRCKVLGEMNPTRHRA